VYEVVDVAKGIRGAQPDLSRPGPAGIRTAGGYVLMLGVYHRQDGIRSVEERQRLNGRRVEISGVLEKRTPAITLPDGGTGATMINPYFRTMNRIALRRR
jgi:hypothetical protein